MGTFFLGPWLLVYQFVEISNQMELNGEVSNFEKKLYKISTMHGEAEDSKQKKIRMILDIYLFLFLSLRLNKIMSYRLSIFIGFIQS